jgi:hypothetical protein
VVPFKRNVYERALHEFADFVGQMWGVPALDAWGRPRD